MIVFKTFFKVLSRYKFSMIMYLVIAIAIITIMSGFNSSGNASYYSVSQGIIVLDNDKSEVSRGLIKYLETINYIYEDSFSDEQITDMIYYTKASNYLVIPQGFGAAFLSGTSTPLKIESTKEVDTRMGYTVEAEMDGYLKLTANYMKGGYSFKEADELSRESLADISAVNMVSEVVIQDDKIFTVFTILPYALLTLLCSAVLPVILRFGTMLINRRTGISSMSSAKKQIMIALASAIVTVGIIVVLIMMSSLLSGEMFTSRWALIAIDVLVFSMTAVMIIIALSSFGINPDAAPAITNIVALSFSFLGGIFVPIEHLGGTAKAIGQFLPTYWYSEAINRIKSGSSFTEILNCLLIQLLFGVMVLVIGLMVGKHNVKKTA